MADYQGLIRVGIQGLGEIRRLNNELRTTVELYANLENAQIIAAQVGQSAQRNVNTAARRRAQAGRDLTAAQRTVGNVAMRLDPATGQIMGGGPNATARRLAGAQLRLAQREVRESDRSLREELQNRRLISAAERRYAIAAGEAGEAMEGLGRRAREQQARLDQAMQGIGRGSRGNYLTNLFQGRQREFARGGAGAQLAPELQRQAQNVRAAWDIATAGGRENLQLMQRLATEMAGLVRQQNELNRSRAGRSAAFEAGRRGQERITDLSRMQGADPARIRRLRSQATNVIATANLGDIAGSRDAQRRMNASIMRYTRELNAAAQELSQQQRAGVRNLNVRQNWTAILAEEQERIRAAQQAANDLYNRDRALSRDFGVNPAMALRPAGMSDEQVARRNLISTRTAAAAEQSAFNAFSRQANEINADMPTLRSIRRNQEKRAKAEARLAAIAEAEAAAREALFARVQKNIDLSQAGREVSNFGFGLAGDPVAKSIRRNQEKRAIAEARLAAIAEAEAAAREALFARIQKNIDLSQASRQASNFGLGFAGDPVAKSIRRNQEKRAIAEAKLAAIAEAEAAARAALFARVQKNIDLSQASRQASNFGFGSADDAVAKSIRRNQEKIARATAREATAAAKRANQADAAARAAEFRRTGGLSFEDRLTRRRPDLVPGANARRQGFFRGSPRKAFGEGLIGGAFPLLFGQGLGASIGGAAGGFGGGLIGGSFGFGLSLVGTALGSAVDNTVQGLKDLASALKSPTDAMAALEASGFRVGDSLKFQVEQLQAVGRGYDAQTLVLQEVQRRLGANGVRDLVTLNAEQKKLEEQWSSIAGAIQGELLPALIGFTQVINGVTGAARGAAEDPIIGRILAIAGKSALAVLPGGPAVVAAAERAGALGRSTAARTPSNVRPARSPQEVLADETTRIQESRRIADQIQSAYREAFKLQRQAYDLQREGADINREIADYSYRKEREIFDLRQQAAEKEIENNRAAAQNRIERGDLSARQTFAAATGFEQQLLTNVRESMRTRKEGEADIEQSRRRLELTMAKLNRDVEDYKRTNAREIEDIERRKLAYTRSVEDYKMQVADYVLQRSREAADLMRQAMTLPDMSGAGGGGGAAPYAAVSPTQRIPFMSEIDKAAREANVDPRLFAGLVKQESAFRPGARSSSGAIGLAQLMPGTARELGVDPFNIQENLRGGARYLRQMLDRFGLEGGLRAYNQGPGAQERTPAGNSRESREYPGRVLANARAFGFNPAAMPAPATMGGAVATTGNTGISSGAHLDVRWADGRPITSAEADRFIRVAGRTPSSFGVTSGYGPRRPPVPGASAFHRGLDFGTPAGLPITLTGGAQLAGSMTPQQSGGGGVVGIINTPMGQMKLLHLERVLGVAQGAAATTISNIPQPRFNATPLGATPSAAPFNAERMAVLSRMVGSEQEAQRILEEQNKLRQKGVELGQIEQILQGNQLPQLEQQYSTLQMQIEARRQNLELSDDAASVADIQAESAARIAQLEKDRTNALAKAQKQFTAPQELQQATKQINEQANLAVDIARREEDQRRKNLDLNNKLQNQERVRSEILQLQEGLAVEKAQAAALERGELEASNVELRKASTLYKDAEEAQQRKLLALTAETEELRKQNEFRQQINQLQQERRFTGAGLRAGMIGEPARRFEQALNEGRSIEQANQLAQEARLLENQQLIWANLEKNIVDVSDAISGALTNGLLDIVSGAREIEDVGRDMLNGIARTFADSAQQQLSTLLQRQIAQFAGPRLAGMIGGGAQQATGAAAGIAGVQALGSASFAASGQVAAFGVALQTVMGQMAFSGVASGLGSAAASGLGSAFSSAAPNILGSFFPGASPLPSFSFGGFLANGGTTRPGEGYIVGEKEPEFFFPGASGRVVPKSDMEKAAALAEEGADNEPIDIRYTVTEQAGERYVTEDQFRKGMAATSKRAQAMAYAGMRNNKEVRDYTGIS